MLARLLSTLPPLITAAIYFYALFDPLALGSERVKDLIVAVLAEIMIVLAVAVTSAARDDPHPLRSAAMFFVAMISFGLLFVSFFAMAFDAPWALLSFVWLALSAVLPAFLARANLAEKFRQLQNGAVVSVVALLAGVFIALTALQLTPFGFTPEAQAGLDLHAFGSGAFIDKPWTGIASGAFYFALVALSRAANLRLVG